MAEEPIWKGTSSHWKNFNAYALTVLSIALAAWLHWGSPALSGWIFLLPLALLLWTLWKWMLIRSMEYELTSERLITRHGILTKVTDTLELYRVRDLQTVQPLLLRMLKLQNVHVITTDASTAEVILDYMPANIALADQLRTSIEACRKAKGVRAMDVVNETPGDHTHDDAGGTSVV